MATIDEIFDAAKANVKIEGTPQSECIWPSHFVFTPDSAFDFMMTCRTWDEASGMVRNFPEKEYLWILCNEWVTCCLEGKPLIIEKSRRLVFSWALRCLELFRLGFSRGNWIITHTKREDAAGHVWRIFFMYEDLRIRFPEWNLTPPFKYGNELSQMIDLMALPNQSRITQYFEKATGLQGSGYTGITMEEPSIYKQPAGMWDQGRRLVQAPAGFRNGFLVWVTNVEFNDGYELVIAGASESPY